MKAARTLAGEADQAGLPIAPQARMAQPLRLSAHLKLEQCFAAIAANCIEQLSGNQAGVAHTEDVECLHQMRIGLRRLRAALDLFDLLLPLPTALQQDLDWLGTQLGQARDLDVLSHTTLPAMIDAAPDEASLAPLLAAAQQAATRARAQAGAAVASLRYERLQAAWARWLKARAWRSTRSPRQRKQLDAPLAEFARRRIDQTQRRLQRRGAALREGDARARHRVRIAAKKARYTLEFLASLYPARKTKPTLRALTDLQDLLGALNDAAVAAGLLRQLQAEQPELAEGCGYARGYLQAQVAHRLGGLDKAWKRYARRAPPH